MTSIDEPSKAQSRLPGELAAAIARAIACRGGTTFPGKQWNGTSIRQHGRAGDVIEHHRVGTFKTVCSVLWRLGLVEPITEEGDSMDKLPYYFRLKLDAQDMPAFIRRHSAADALSIDEILGAFIDCLSHFELISTGRQPFAVACERCGVMELIAEAGYAGKSGGAYLWTDKAGPIMQRIYAWNPDNEDYEELRADKQERESETALLTMPDEIMRALMEQPNSFFHFAIIINRHWKDGKWQKMSEHKGETVFQGGLGLSVRFMEKFADSFGFGAARD